MLIKSIFPKNPHFLIKSTLYFFTINLPKITKSKQLYKLLKQKSRMPSTQAQKYIQQYRKWFNNMTPLLLQHTKQLPNYCGYYQLFYFCQKIRYHRLQIFNMVQNNMKDMQQMRKLNLLDLIKIYQVGVLFKHTNNPNLFTNLREVIKQRFKIIGIINPKDSINFYNYIQSILLDRLIQKQQKQKILLQLSQCINKSLKQLQQIKSTAIFIINNIYQQIKLYNIQISTQFMEFLMKISKQINSLSKQISSKMYAQKSQSIFERTLIKYLIQLRYSFDRNIQVNGNQYDLLIKSRQKQKNCPLAGISIDFSSQFPSSSTNQNQNTNTKQTPFNLSKLTKIIQQKQLQYISKYTKLRKVILNLNGPIHYIDSNILPQFSITRKQQFKYQKLALYGYTHYNIINYKEWEYANKYQKLSQKLTYDKIFNPLAIANIGK